ncbi:MAG: site-2 protease family protein [Clostridia bacterium]|nr:site-2 protease family protein [Clostridia bacterium]
MLRNIISNEMGILGAVFYIASALIVIFLTMPVHEYAHGLIAYKLGDNTPKWQGRLTLNPFAHIDYLGALSILLFGFGWAKPVRVNMNNFKNPKIGMALTALAGPLSNLIVAFIALLLFNLSDVIFLYFDNPILKAILINVLYYIALINVSLAVFNLIPIPPLDGSRILSVFLPNRIYYSIMRYERYIYFGLLAILWIGILDIPLSILKNLTLNGLNSLAYLPFKLLGY